MTDDIDIRALPHDQPHLPPMDCGTEGTSMIDAQNNAPVEHTINKRVHRMKHKNCGVLHTKKSSSRVMKWTSMMTT